MSDLDNVRELTPDEMNKVRELAKEVGASRPSRGLDPRQLLVHVVRPALTHLELPGGELAEKLVMGTACQESGGFRYIHQLGRGPALSLWQIEPVTALDALARCPLLLRGRVRALIAARPLSGKWPIRNTEDDLLLMQLPGNLFLGAALCRLVYYMKPFKMPDKPPSDARNWCGATWKKHYNTVKGAGKEAQFMDHWAENGLDKLWS